MNISPGASPAAVQYRGGDTLILGIVQTGIADKRFRPDLYYRLSVFPIRMPALRDRAEDVPVLAEHFLRHFARKLGKAVTKFSDDAVDQMRRYAWPGNVRELQNVIERAVILCADTVIQAAGLCLPDALRLARKTAPGVAASPSITASPLAVPDSALPIGTPQTLAGADRIAIVNALNNTHWRTAGQTGRPGAST